MRMGLELLGWLPIFRRLSREIINSRMIWILRSSARLWCRWITNDIGILCRGSGLSSVHTLSTFVPKRSQWGSWPPAMESDQTKVQTQTNVTLMAKWQVWQKTYTISCSFASLCMLFSSFILRFWARFLKSQLLPIHQSQAFNSKNFRII